VVIPVAILPTVNPATWKPFMRYQKIRAFCIIEDASHAHWRKIPKVTMFSAAATFSDICVFVSSQSKSSPLPEGAWRNHQR